MVLAVILPEQNILGFNPLQETILALAKQDSSTKLIVFSQGRQSRNQGLSPNISYETLPKNWNNVLVKSFWYSTSLKKLIKSHGITHFWSADAYKLKNSSVSTAVFADDYFLKDNWFSLRRSMAKSSARLLFSEEAFPKIIKQKFGNVGAAIILPQSLPIVETSSQSLLYDVPYFLCYTKGASKLEVLQLFKAFSFFKRRMSSSTKLILLTEGIQEAESVDNFQNYKFREDVHFEPNPNKEKLFNLLQNCVAWVNLTPSSTPSFPIYLAAQAGKPVIARNDEEKGQIFGETLAYFDSQETLAAQMINMYKDENLRSFFADLGLSMAAQKINEFQNLALNKLLANTEL